MVFIKINYIFHVMLFFNAPPSVGLSATHAFDEGFLTARMTIDPRY